MGESTNEKNAAPAPSQRGRWVVLALFAVLLPVFHHSATEKAEKDNTGVTERGYDVIFDYDQHPYLNVARKLRDENFRWVTPRHRMPGYSLLLIPLYDPETAHEIDPTGEDPRRAGDAFFRRGKAFNIFLSLATLCLLYLFSRRWMPRVEALIVTWAFGLLLAVFKAPYVQPEVIFYLTFTVSFVLLLRQLEAPTWRNGLLSGAALAATFLLKSAVIPLIALFVACFALRAVVDAILRARRDGLAAAWRPLPRLVALGVLPLIIFCALLSPYLWNTWKLFGSPFWDAHSKHYMWMDTAEEKYKWRDLRISEPDFVAPPGEEPPNVKKYLAEHSLADIVRRPVEGWEVLLPRVAKDYGALFKFIDQFCFMAVLMVAVLHWREVLAAFQSHWSAVLMVAGFFIGYSLLYSWYVAIRVGPRLILGLALPLIFVCLWFISRFGGEFRVPRVGWRVNDRNVARAILGVAVAVLGWRVLRTDLWMVEGGQ